MSESTTHNELKNRAKVYLMNKGFWICGIEVPMPLGICDAWGMSRADNLLTAAVEVKISKMDFKSRSQKYKESSSYPLGNFQYIMCPEGLLQPEEMHPEWGLLWATKDRIFNKKNSPKVEMSDRQKLNVLLYFLHNGANPKRPEFPREEPRSTTDVMEPLFVTGESPLIYPIG